MALNPIINYDAHLLNPGVDLTLTGVGTPTLTASYGDYGGSGESGTLKANCTLSISYSDVTTRVDSHNNVIIEGTVTGGTLTRTHVANSTNTQQITAWFNGQQVFQTIVNTGASGTFQLLPTPYYFSISIPPSNDPQPQYGPSIHFLNANMQKTDWTKYPPDEFTLGLVVTNPNPPDYRPGKVLDSDGQWQSHNRSAGAANVLNGQRAWTEMRTASGGEQTGNPPTIAGSGFIFHNMRKIGENADN